MIQRLRLRLRLVRAQQLAARSLSTGGVRGGAPAVHARGRRWSQWPLPGAGEAYSARLRRLPRRHVQTVSQWCPVGADGHLRVRLPREADVRVSVLPPEEWSATHVSLDVSEPDGERGAAANTTAAAAAAASDGGGVSEAALREATDAFGLRIFSDSVSGTVTLEAPQLTAPQTFLEHLHRARQWVGGPLRPAPRPALDSRFTLHVRIPGRMSLDVEMTAGTFTLTDGTLEGDFVLHSDTADTKVHRLKSMLVHVSSKEGDIDVKHIEGNAELRSGSGNIDVERLNGLSASVETEEGAISVGALYSRRAWVRSSAGDILLGSVHGHTLVRAIEGYVSVESVDGDLEVETDAGDVSAFLSAPRRVQVLSRSGDVKLGVNEDASAEFELHGPLIDVDKQLRPRDVSESEEECGGGGVVRSMLFCRGDNDDDGGANGAERGHVSAFARQGEVRVLRQTWLDRVVHGDTQGIEMETDPRSDESRAARGGGGGNDPPTPVEEPPPAASRYTKP